MSVTKTFDFSDITSQIQVYGTHEEPLFRLNQIEKVLGKTNLHGTVASFDDDEKCLRNAYTARGEKEVIFLTEAGIIRLMHVVRGSAIAHSFRKWICTVVRTIRLEGKYELETSQTKLIQDAEAAQKEVAEAKAALEREKAKTEDLKRQLKDKHQVGESVYLIENAADDERNLYKIGKSQDLSRREKDFETYFPDGTNTIHCRHCTNSALVEKLMYHVLAKYRYNPKREWFQGSAKYFAKLLDAVVDFVDGLVAAGENIVQFDFNKRLEKLMKKAQRFDPDEEDGTNSDTSGVSITNVVVTGSGNNVVVGSSDHSLKEVVKRFVTEKITKAPHPDDILTWVELKAEYEKENAKVKRYDLRKELAKNGLIYRDSSVNNKKFTGYLGWKLKEP